MNLIFLTEHYHPRVGGVTSFINSLCKAIHLKGHQIWLVAPGVHSDGEVIVSEVDFGYLVSIGSGIDLTGIIPSRSRIQFSYRASEWIRDFSSPTGVEVVHILYGLYLMKYLNVDFLKGRIFKGCTIHNIPPQECATSWRGDNLLRYWKDRMRLRLVGWVNKRRIKSQSWSSYVVPSHFVAGALSKIVHTDKVHVIGHGLQTGINISRKEELSKPLQLLTVSGFTPHKGQHLIPSTLRQLLSAGIKVKWDVVGPNKNDRYVNGIIEEIRKYDLDDELGLHFSVTPEQLEAFFQNAHIYVHTSKEEGFCLAALEAATFGLPVIGRPTGAIPEIIEAGKGTLYQSEEELVSGILELVKNYETYHYSTEDLNQLNETYSWQKASQEYIELFQSHINS